MSSAERSLQNASAAQDVPVRKSVTVKANAVSYTHLEAGDAVSHIQLSGFLELLFLPVGHHAESHRQHLFRRDAGNVGDGRELAIHAQIGVVTDFQVQVREMCIRDRSSTAGLLWNLVIELGRGRP